MQLWEVKRPLVALAALFFCLLNFYFLKYSPTSSVKDQGCVRLWITSFIYFFDHEQAVSWESCNLIGSGRRAVFSYLLTTGMVTNYTKRRVKLQLERAKFQNMTKTKKQKHWQKQKTKDDKNVTFLVFLIVSPTF